MSIYIKDMRLPSADELTGSVKVLLLYSDGMIIDNANGTPIGQAVELPEHGRLIDADAFAAEMKERQIEAGKWLREAKDHDTAVRADAVLSFLCEVKLTLDKAPTIIPADGGET